jgi:hypothetical protein
MSPEYDTAGANDNVQVIRTIPISLMKAFQENSMNEEGDDSDDRKTKRLRRASLLDELPPRRASFAGAA